MRLKIFAKFSADIALCFNTTTNVGNDTSGIVPPQPGLFLHYIYMVGITGIIKFSIESRSFNSSLLCNKSLMTGTLLSSSFPFR